MPWRMRVHCSCLTFHGLFWLYLLNGRIIVRGLVRSFWTGFMSRWELYLQDLCLFSEQAPLLRAQINVFRKSCEEAQGLRCFLEVDVYVEVVPEFAQYRLERAGF